MRHAPLLNLSKLSQALLELPAKMQGSRSILLCPYKLAETEAAMQPDGIRGKIITRQTAASQGGQHHTRCPCGTLLTHCQAAQTDSPHGNAKQRKDAPSPGQAQPSPSLQPNCPGALASRPKPGDPLAEPCVWEDDACASVRDRAAFVYRPLAMALRTPHPPPARSKLQERKLHEPEGLME